MSGRRGELKRLRELGKLLAQFLIGEKQFADQGLQADVLCHRDRLFFGHLVPPYPG
jgi:hypothetical protein